MQYLYAFWTPTNAANIWSAIDYKISRLDRLIDRDEQLNERIDGAFEQGVAILNLVRALPKHSSELSPKKLEEIKPYVTSAQTAAHQLYFDGEVNNKVAVKAELVELKKILANLREFYPSEAKKAG